VPSIYLGTVSVIVHESSLLQSRDIVVRRARLRGPALYSDVIKKIAPRARKPMPVTGIIHRSDESGSASFNRPMNGCLLRDCGFV
jgi:hypothetical protein